MEGHFTFGVDLLANTTDPPVLDGSLTTVDVKERVGQHKTTSTEQYRRSKHAARSLGHLRTTRETSAAALLLHLSQAAHGLLLPVVGARHLALFSSCESLEDSCATEGRFVNAGGGGGGIVVGLLAGDRDGVRLMTRSSSAFRVGPKFWPGTLGAMELVHLLAGATYSTECLSDLTPDLQCLLFIYPTLHQNIKVRTLIVEIY